MTSSRTLSVILAADAVGYSRLAEQDEAAALAAVSWFRERAAEIVTAHGGRIFFRAGDGVMAEFPNAKAGVGAALELAETVRIRTAHADRPALPVRIGAHLGDVSEQTDGDRLGHDVNVAARIQQIAEPGEILVSRVLAEAARGKAEARFERVGAERVKNLAEPIEVFRVLPEAARAASPRARLMFAGVGAAVLAAVTAGLALTYWLGQRPAEPAQAASETTEVAAAPAPRTPPGQSIAVLAFTDLSPEGDQEYFSDGLAEELLNELANIDGLQVAGRTSSFAFKGRNASFQEIGETLGVATVLEGSVRKDGDNLRITAQLINAADGYHLWSETYDRQLVDVFAVQEEIAAAVAAELSVTLGMRSGGGLSASPPSVEVYDLYLRGLSLIGVRNPDDYLMAADIFRAVVALDPDFGRARVALAEIYIPILTLFPERAAQSSLELEEVVADALAHAPNDPASQRANAVLQVHRQNWLEAEAALARSPGQGSIVPAPLEAMLLLDVGRASDAVNLLYDRVRYDPLSPDPTLYLQQALTALDRVEEADTEFRRTNELGLFVPPNEHMALIRAWRTSDDALIQEQFDRYIAIQTVTTPLDRAVRAVYDDPAAALALVREAADDPEMQDATRQLFISIYASHYGDPDLAVAALRRSLVDMKGPLAQGLWFPDMADARRTEAFKDLVRNLGLVDYWRATGNWGDFCRPLGDDDFECF